MTAGCPPDSVPAHPERAWILKYTNRLTRCNGYAQPIRHFDIVVGLTWPTGRYGHGLDVRV